MPVYIDPATGERYANVPDADADKARGFGFLPEEEHLANLAAEEHTARYGTGQQQLRTGAEEIARMGVSTAALLPGVGDVDAMGNPITTTEGASAAGAAPSLYTGAALERREENPGSAALGAALPSVVGALALPAAGLPGLAASLGLAGAGSVANEAAGADIDGRPIDPWRIVATAGIDLGLQAATLGVSKAVGATYQAVAPRASNLMGRLRGAARKGGDVADEVASQQQLAEAVADAADEIRAAPMPKVAPNPISQRSAIEDLAIEMDKASPDLARQLRTMADGTAGARFRGLADLAEHSGEETAARIQSVLEDESLWGKAAVQHRKAQQATEAARPDIDAVNSSVSRADAIRISRNGDQEAARIQAALGYTGPAQKGALQRWHDALASVSNAEKRTDYGKWWQELPESTRAQGSVRLSELAQQSSAAADAVESLGQKKAADNIRALIADVAEDASPASADRLKNALQKARQNAAQAARKGNTYADNAVTVIDEFEQPLRSGLMDPEIVGAKVADMQRSRNALWSDKSTGFIANRDRMAADGHELFTAVNRRGDYDGVIEYQLKGSALKSLIAMPQSEAALALDTFEDMVRSSRNMAREAQRVGAVGSDAKALGTLAREADATLAEIAKIRRLQAARAEMGTETVVDQLGKGAAGAAAGVAPGIASGAVRSVGEGVASRISEAFASKVTPRRAVDADGVTRFVSALRSSPGGEAAAAKVEDALGRHMGARMGNDGPAQSGVNGRWTALSQRAGAGLAGANRIATKLTRAATPPAAAAIERFTGQDRTLEQAYWRSQRTLDASHPDALAAAADRDLEGAPLDVRATAMRQTARVLAYLQSESPKRVGVSASRPDGRPASYTEMRSYALKADAALNPEGVFEDAARGLVRREQLEALAACWPQAYDELRASTLEQLGQRSTPVARQRASLLFGFGAELDAALGAEVTQLAVNARAMRAKEAESSTPQMQRSSPRSVGAMATSGDRALAGNP